MRTFFNVAIILLLALAVAVLPGGDDATDVILTALSIAFLAVIAWFAYRLYKEQQLTMATLSDSRRAILFGALGVIALLVAGADELFDSGGGTLAWIAGMALAVLAIVAVWREATSYS
jgi:hypothetical protein